MSVVVLEEDLKHYKHINTAANDVSSEQLCTLTDKKEEWLELDAKKNIFQKVHDREAQGMSQSPRY